MAEPDLIASSDVLSENILACMDSGMGGVPHFLELARHLPCKRAIYLVEGEHHPVGDLPPEKILEVVRKNAEFLVQHYRCNLLALGCNTFDAIGLNHLKKGWRDTNKRNESLSPEEREYWRQLSIIGVIRPNILSTHQTVLTELQEQVMARGVDAPIPIILAATQATIDSGVYQTDFANWYKNYNRRSPFNFQVLPMPCPGVANAIEHGDKALRPMIDRFSERLVELVHELKNGDEIFPLKIPFVPGCTHYDLEVARTHFNNSLVHYGIRPIFVRSASAVFSYAKDYLSAKARRLGLRLDLTEKPFAEKEFIFLTTGNPETANRAFRRMGFYFPDAVFRHVSEVVSPSQGKLFGYTKPNNPPEII